MNDQDNIIETTPTEQKGMDRRQLLTQLGATGLIGTGLLISGEWRKPVVQAANLPPHAQVTPIQLHTISCGWLPQRRTTFANISPPDPGISLIVEIYDRTSPTPTTPVEGGTFTTDTSGQATCDHTLGGCPLLYAVWRFSDPSQGTDTCQTADYEPPC